jgi:hypothetical protein
MIFSRIREPCRLQHTADLTSRSGFLDAQLALFSRRNRDDNPANATKLKLHGFSKMSHF